MHFTKAMPRRFTKSNLRRDTCSTSVPNLNQNHPPDDENNDNNNDSNNDTPPVPPLDISDQTYSPDNNLITVHRQDDSEVPDNSFADLDNPSVVENGGNNSEPFETIETTNQAFMYFEMMKNNFNKNHAKS